MSMEETERVIRQIVIHTVGNRLRNEELQQPETCEFGGVEARESEVLGAGLEELVWRLAEKGTPYRLSEQSAVRMQRLTEDATFRSAAEKLSEILYEEVSDPSMPTCRLIIATLNVDWHGRKTVCALICPLDAPVGVLRVESSRVTARSEWAEGFLLDHLKRGFLYVSGKNESYVITDAAYKNLLVNGLLDAKPVLTDKIKGKFATSMVKAVSDKLKSTAEADRFKKSVQELVQHGDSFDEGELATCCRQFVSDEDYKATKEKLVKKVECDIPSDTPLASEAVGKKLNRFIKSIRLGKDLALTISGKQELDYIERLQEDPETGTYVIKLILRQPEEK